MKLSLFNLKKKGHPNLFDCGEAYLVPPINFQVSVSGKVPLVELANLNDIANVVHTAGNDATPSSKHKGLKASYPVILLVEVCDNYSKQINFYYY